MDATEAKEGIKKISMEIAQLKSSAATDNRALSDDERAWILEAEDTIKDLVKYLPLERETVPQNAKLGDYGMTAAIPRPAEGGGKDYKSMFNLSRGLDSGGFKDTSEFIRCIDSGRFDPRLDILNTMQETVPSSGGFAVPTEFAADWLDASLPNEIVRKLCRVYPMTSETKIIPGWDGADMSAGATHGGFAMTFLGEGAQALAQTPKLRQVTLTARMASIYVNASLELTQDAASFDQNLRAALIKSIGYGIDRYCLSAAGTGAGCPQSILNAPCKIQVAGEHGQATDTVTYQNIKKMFARQLNPQNAVWLFNNSSVPELLEVTVQVGLGGNVVPLLNEKDGSFTIFGRPVFFHPSMPALGDADSAAFVDFSFYGLGLRKELWIEQSDAPRWDYRERSYRILMRFDAMCTLDKVITPEHGATLSPIVTLAAI